MTCATIELDAAACSRCFAPFPTPVRTLDALHLAAADYLRSQGVHVDIATYDDRMRGAAEALGFSVVA